MCCSVPQQRVLFKLQTYSMYTEWKSILTSAVWPQRSMRSTTDICELRCWNFSLLWSWLLPSMNLIFFAPVEYVGDFILNLWPADCASVLWWRRAQELPNPFLTLPVTTLLVTLLWWDIGTWSCATLQLQTFQPIAPIQWWHNWLQSLWKICWTISQDVLLETEQLSDLCIPRIHVFYLPKF